jgi:hypothetical protein
MTTATRRETSTAGTVTNSDGVLSLLNALQGSSGKTDAWRRTLKCIGEHFASPFAAIEIESSNVTLTDQMSASAESTKSWKRHCDGLMLSVRQSGTARARLFQAAATDLKFAILAVPVPDHGTGMIGTFAVVIACETTPLAEARMSELGALVRAAAVFSSGSSRIPSAGSSHPATAQSIPVSTTDHTTSGGGGCCGLVTGWQTRITA